MTATATATAKRSPASKASTAKPMAAKPQKAKEQAPERSYGMSKAEIVEAKATAKTEKAHPATMAYREGSSYWCIIAALSKHEGKMIDVPTLVKEFVKVCDTAKLKSFKSKEARVDGADTSLAHKVEVNAGVTARNDYGKPVRQLGFEVRRERSDEGKISFGLFKLAAK